MRACIIVFSPGGHTLSVAQTIGASLEHEGIAYQLLNVTGLRELSDIDKLRSWLENTIEEHDVLFIGSPVYAGHLESNMLRLISCLPSQEQAGGSAVPFVTYGGSHSSIALIEAGESLHAMGRTCIGGLKISSEHTLTQTLPVQKNAARPNDEDMQFVRDFVQRLIFKIRHGDFEDVSQAFYYVSDEEERLYRQKSQDDWHCGFRTVHADVSRCVGCGTCVPRCPVARISIENGIARFDDTVTCILCSECFTACPQKAISFPYLDAVKARMVSGNMPAGDDVDNAAFL